MPEFTGTLRHPVTLEQPTQTPGNAVVTWSPVATLWAEMRASGGTEASSLLAEGQYRFVTRFRDGVTAQQRLGFGARKFNIMSVQDPDGRRESLEIIATELVPGGGV